VPTPVAAAVAVAVAQPKSRNQKKVAASPLPKNLVVQHPRNPLPPIPLAAKNPAGRKRRSHNLSKSF
jgi:hypothetical protein